MRIRWPPEPAWSALTPLAQGARDALVRLGSDLLHQPANHSLREAFTAGTLDATGYYRLLLRLLFRLLIRALTEHRAPEAGGARLSEADRGAAGVWQELRGLPAPLGATAELTEGVAEEVLGLLGLLPDQKFQLRSALPPGSAGRVFGALYEALLELQPRLTPTGPGFELLAAADHARKTSGSYYTPEVVVNRLLDQALQPLLEQAAHAESVEAALLALRICDPACGAGHFLVAAARRVAGALARARSGPIPPPETYRTALGEVLDRCLYGVDRDPLALELTRFHLWLLLRDATPGDTLPPWPCGPHLACGNALIGAPADAPEAQDPAGADRWCAGRLRPGAHLTPAQVDALARDHGVFHWHLAFPERWPPHGPGGFDCVLGNPPWERIKLMQREWFGPRAPELAGPRTGSLRRRSIAALEEQAPRLHDAYRAAVRVAEEESRFCRGSGLYPRCGRGDLNRYALFAERMRSLRVPSGALGCVLPTGIVTDASNSRFLQDILAQGERITFCDRENRGLFPGVDERQRFGLLTLRRAGPGAEAAPTAEFTFFAQELGELPDPRRTFSLDAAELVRLNPETRTCPSFRTRRDAELILALHRRLPHLGTPEGWGVGLHRQFDMTEDSGLFRTRASLAAAGFRQVGNRFVRGGAEFCPLYEGKMFAHFTHRWAHADGTVLEDPGDPAELVQPRYWVDREELARRTAGQPARGWCLAYRWISNATNARTFQAAILPAVPLGNSAPRVLLAEPDPQRSACWIALTSSLVFDHLVRQKLAGNNLTFGFVRQLPLPPPAWLQTPVPWSGQGVSWVDWLWPRVLELTYTAWDLAALARDGGWRGPPFRWSAGRREQLRVELDAAALHLFLPRGSDGGWAPGATEQAVERARLEECCPTPAAAAAHILDSFPLLRRREEQQQGEFRTRRLVLACYEALATAQATATEYLSPLDPGPAHPSLAHRDAPRPAWLPQV